MKSTKRSTAGLCSVICTTYNHAKYSRSAIESIVAQNYRPIEVIVVDDGSTDENVEVIRAALSESGLPHTLITQKNTGNVAINANRAIAAARGEFFVLTSLDDLLMPECVSSKMELMLADPLLAMVGNSTSLEIDETGSITNFNCRYPVFGKETASAEEMRELEFSNIHTFFLQGTALRANFIAEIGGFEKNCAGDDLILRTKIWIYLAARPDLRFVFLRQSGFAYRKHAENLHGNRYRQLCTVLEWRNRFFPDRPLPYVAQQWACNYFDQLLATGDHKSLKEAIESDQQLMKTYKYYRGTWKFRRRTIKYFLRRLFGVAPANCANHPSEKKAS